MTAKEFSRLEGMYVKILSESQGYRGIVPGTMGYVVTDRWLPHDGTVAVDVFDPGCEGIVNLTFEPSQLEPFDEERLKAEEPVSSLRIQYELLKSRHENLKTRGQR